LKSLSFFSIDPSPLDYKRVHASCTAGRPAPMSGNNLEEIAKLIPIDFMYSNFEYDTIGMI
jgi:hypothetical protein